MASRNASELFGQFRPVLFHRVSGLAQVAHGAVKCRAEVMEADLILLRFHLNRPLNSVRRVGFMEVEWFLIRVGKMQIADFVLDRS